jgi:hypothetical protein
MLQDLKGYDKSLVDYIEGFMKSVVDEPHEQALFMPHLGGNVLMVESKEEFQKMFADYGSEPEIFRQLDHHMAYGYITNNSGGPIFIVSNDLYDEIQGTRNDIDDSVDETNYDPYAGCDTFDRGE